MQVPTTLYQIKAYLLAFLIIQQFFEKLHCQSFLGFFNASVRISFRKLKLKALFICHWFDLLIQVFG